MSAAGLAPATGGLSPFWMFTAGGLAFDYANPTADMIDARALAWQLSGEGRWANNTHWHLSVAQHSLLVAYAIPTPHWRIYGLLHDAAEAFTRDLPTPFKHWLAAAGADIKGLEGRILEAVWAHFALVPPKPIIQAAVDLADARALATEYRDVVRGKDDRWVPDAEPLRGPTIPFKARDKVELEFLYAIDAMSRDADANGLRSAA